MISFYKILHTTCGTQWGGVEKRIFNESVWMEKKGHKIIIAAPGQTPLFLAAKEHGFKTYGLEFKRFTTIKDYNFLKKILYNEKPDIINTHGTKVSKLALLAAKKADVPLRILSRHDGSHVRNSWSNRRVYKKLCHYIFTSADHTTRELQKTFKLKGMEIFTMPTGIIEPDHLLEKNQARQMLAKELNLDPDTKFIGFSGRVSKGKKLSILLEAFQKIKPELPGYHIVIAGEGPDDVINSLKKQAQVLRIDSHIQFAGFKEDAWSFYRAFDCLILPSIDIKETPFEGSPQVVLEAMACNCPVVGPENNGLLDIIEHEKTGLLFDTNDPDDLADKIRQTLQDKEASRQRSETARMLVEKNHTIDAMGRNIIRIYRLHQVKLDRQHF